jgi:uncharacterized protein YciI
MISDEFMQAELARSVTYSLVLLREGPNYADATRELIWEHGRRNFQLRADGVMNIVGPLRDDGDIKGICILNVDVAKAAEVMDGDPAVEAGVFTCDIRPLSSFPGDALG